MENLDSINSNSSSFISIMDTNTTSNESESQGSHSFWSTGQVLIPVYSIIFLLSVIGNSLVILTLVQNQRMRTVTNVFLLNLSVSDLLLGVVCMPTTLVGALLRDFIFGEAMCKLISYFQGKNVFLLLPL